MRPVAIAIAVGVMVVLGVAFYFAAWSPLDDQETALRTETQQLDDQAQQLRNQLTQLREIQDSELAIRADLNRLRGLIPTGDPAQPSFVRSVQLAADASGVAIDSLTFGQPAAVEGATANSEGLVLSEIDLAADVQGGYFQMVDLFRRLEIEVVRAVQVDSLTIAEGEDGFPQLNTSMTGRIFALLPVATVTEEGTEPVEGGEAAPADDGEGDVGEAVPGDAVDDNTAPPDDGVPGEAVPAGEAPGGEAEVQ